MHMTGVEWMLIGVLLIGVAIVYAVLHLSERERINNFMKYQQEENDRLADEYERHIPIWPTARMLSNREQVEPASVLYGPDGSIYLLMPRAELQGDEPVKVNPALLGERDASGHFSVTPRLDQVLRAATYVKPKGEENGTQS